MVWGGPFSDKLYNKLVGEFFMCVNSYLTVECAIVILDGI